ncbi:MAG TPA: ABC transporter permease [Candidatus Dorea gallistercoris]|uniref:ABC transporter permease n=1 Tax=Candidatus Dorea gallistercoris TaxID=2838542 RepID=A0A9D1RA51_9FIRM|nr:ABC transporter permease [Candidatus Dorea gallistercoris]
MYFFTILEKRQVKVMLLFEVKKVLTKPLNKAALLILAAVFVIACVLTIRYVDYTDQDGNTVTGISAAHGLREMKNQWAGDVTEDVIREAVRQNAAINASDEALSEDIQEQNKAYGKKQGFEDIREMLNMSFSGIKQYDYYTADNLTEDEAAGLYEQRLQSLKDYLDSGQVDFTENEKEYLLQNYGEFETPVHYEYAEGWMALMDSAYFITLMMILVLILGFLVSGIFSDEFAWKADAIFFSSRTGRGRAILAKMGAGLLIITVLYWGVVLLFAGVVLAALGAGGGDCPVQIWNWYSIYNITYFQDYLLSAVGGYIGALFILILSMLASARTHSTVFAITIPFALTCVAPFLGRVDTFSKPLRLFPDQLLQICANLRDFELYEIGGKVLRQVDVLIPMYLILAVAIFPLLYVVYRRSQVK